MSDFYPPKWTRPLTPPKSTVTVFQHQKHVLRA